MSKNGMAIHEMDTKDIRALMDTCHRLREYDSWFDELAREYRSRVDRRPVVRLRRIPRAV